MLLKKNKNSLKIFDSIGSFFKNIFKKKSKLKVEYKKQERPLSDDDYNKIKVEKQKKIDAILDKISKSGYDTLSKDEKEFLFSASNKR